MNATRATLGEKALALLAYLDEVTADRIAEYNQAAADLMTGDRDADECDHVRDEAGYEVLEVVAGVLEAARDAGILPQVVTA